MSNLTAGELLALRTLAAEPNGQALVVAGRLPRELPAVKLRVVRYLETLGLVETVNPAWAQLTEAGRAELEAHDEGASQRWLERKEREARRRAWRT